MRHLGIGYYRPAPELGHNDCVQLYMFAIVRTLRLCRFWVGHNSPALENVTGATVTQAEADMLPTLGLLCLGCPQVGFLAFFENFVAVRQHSGRPVTVVNYEREFEERFRSYLREKPTLFFNLYT